MKTNLKNIVMLTPFIMLLMDGVGLFMYMTDYEHYEVLHNYLFGQFTNHSLLVVFFMYFYAHIHNFCLYSKISIVGLGLLNLFNVCYFLFGLKSYTPYALIIVTITLLLAIIFIIKRK